MIGQEVELTRQIDVVWHDLASVLAGTSEAFVSLDLGLRLLTLNDAAAANLGAAREELVGRSLLEVLPAVVAGALESTLRAAVAGRQVAPVEQFYPPDGRWFDVRCYPVPQGLIVFANDITERKGAEQMLVAAKRALERRCELRSGDLGHANQLLAAVFDRASGGIALTDIAGNFVSANPAYQSLVGHGEHGLIGTSLADLIAPDDYPAMAGQLGGLLDGEADECRMEVRVRRADGSVTWVSSFLSAIEDEQRQPRYFVQVANDITERKRAEAGRRAAQVELIGLHERLQAVRESERTALAR
jgi:PAS domain S-box-containing protein